jgi:hypothetical protein
MVTLFQIQSLWCRMVMLRRILEPQREEEVTVKLEKTAE